MPYTGVQGIERAAPEGHRPRRPPAGERDVVQQQLQHEAGGLCSLV